MRALLGVDNTPASEDVIRNALLRRWPAGSRIRVLTVVSSRIPALPDPGFATAAAREQSMQWQREEAPRLLRDAARRIERATHVPVSAEALEGTPSDVIVEEARAWGADLIILGARRHGTLREKIFGSTTRHVAESAPCPVEIARPDGRPISLPVGG
jgi:nucleotide-binding universal stress UspA family protein